MLDKRGRRWIFGRRRRVDPMGLDDEMITKHAELFDVKPRPTGISGAPLFATRPVPVASVDHPPLFGVEPAEPQLFATAPAELDVVELQAKVFELNPASDGTT